MNYEVIILIGMIHTFNIEAIFESLSLTPHPSIPNFPPPFPVTLTTLKDFILYNYTFLNNMFTLALDSKLSRVLIDDKAS